MADVIQFPSTVRVSCPYWDDLAATISAQSSHLDPRMVRSVLAAVRERYIRAAGEGVDVFFSCGDDPDVQAVVLAAAEQVRMICSEALGRALCEMFELEVELYKLRGPRRPPRVA